MSQLQSGTVPAAQREPALAALQYLATQQSGGLHPHRTQLSPSPTPKVNCSSKGAHSLVASSSSDSLKMLPSFFTAAESEALAHNFYGKNLSAASTSSSAASRRNIEMRLVNLSAPERERVFSYLRALQGRCNANEAVLPPRTKTELSPADMHFVLEKLHVDTASGPSNMSSRDRTIARSRSNLDTSVQSRTTSQSSVSAPQNAFMVDNSPSYGAASLERQASESDKANFQLASLLGGKEISLSFTGRNEGLFVSSPPSEETVTNAIGLPRFDSSRRKKSKDSTNDVEFSRSTARNVALQFLPPCIERKRISKSPDNKKSS